MDSHSYWGVGIAEEEGEAVGRAVRAASLRALLDTERSGLSEAR